jgi:hypothetical protein
MLSGGNAISTFVFQSSGPYKIQERKLTYLDTVNPLNRRPLFPLFRVKNYVYSRATQGDYRLQASLGSSQEHHLVVIGVHELISLTRHES